MNNNNTLKGHKVYSEELKTGLKYDNHFIARLTAECASERINVNIGVFGGGGLRLPRP